MVYCTCSLFLVFFSLGVLYFLARGIVYSTELVGFFFLSCGVVLSFSWCTLLLQIPTDDNWMSFETVEEPPSPPKGNFKEILDQNFKGNFKRP